MKLRNAVEVLTAAHLAYLVDAPPAFQARSGMMFVAHTGALKTAITKTLDAWKPKALVLGDLTIRQLGELREDIAGKKITTLAFTEFPKLYARNQDVASNIEGALHQMADDGLRSLNFEAQTMTVPEAKALIVAAMPTKFYKKKWNHWQDTGWARRFLWCHFQLGNPEILMEAADTWQPLDFGKLIYAFPASGHIPFTTNDVDSKFLRGILRDTKASYEVTPFILLKKIFSVLKWRYAEEGKKLAQRKAVEIMADFSECLKGVADLQIDLPLRGNVTGEDRKPAERVTVMGN
jgi:hypothetical protein